jgi:uncharacterized protein YqgV (UPF0045/DUF77 family)
MSRRRPPLNPPAGGKADPVQVTIEFMVEPFRDAAPGPHVQAALAAARANGLELQLGPFATTIVGEESAVLGGLQPIIAAALDAGATRVSLQVQRNDP